MTETPPPVTAPVVALPPAAETSTSVVDSSDVVGPARRPWLHRAGIASWSFVGIVAVLTILVVALAAIAEVVIPVMLAVLLAVIFKPQADALVRRDVHRSLAAGIVIVGLIAVLTAVSFATVEGIVTEAAKITASLDESLRTLAAQAGIDQDAIDEASAAVQSAGPMIGAGLATRIVSGIGGLIGFISGVLLGALVFYYLVKDGAILRARLVDTARVEIRDDLDLFISDSCATLRNYGRGRTIMSAIVSGVIGGTALLLGLPLILSIVVITFIGGYIPYIGAFVAGAYAVLIALGEGSGSAATMLGVSLAANLALENFVEPKVMGRSLDIHPVAVLIVTAIGGMLGGIIGLIVAVPFAVIVRGAFVRMRASGYVDQIAAAARPAGENLLAGD